MTLIVDHCLDKGVDPNAPTSSQGPDSLALAPHLCRGSASLPWGQGPLGWGAPLQLAGRPLETYYKGENELFDLKLNNGDDLEGLKESFAGCISHIQINNKVSPTL